MVRNNKIITEPKGTHALFEGSPEKRGQLNNADQTEADIYPPKVSCSSSIFVLFLCSLKAKSFTVQELCLYVLRKYLKNPINALHAIKGMVVRRVKKNSSATQRPKECAIDVDRL